MTHLRIRKKHALPIEVVKNRLKPSMEAAARSYGLRLRWEGNVCRFNGPASGSLQVTDGAVMLTARLGLFAQLAEQDIGSEIKRIFDLLGG